MEADEDGRGLHLQPPAASPTSDALSTSGDSNISLLQSLSVNDNGDPGSPPAANLDEIDHQLGINFHHLLDIPFHQVPQSDHLPHHHDDNQTTPSTLQHQIDLNLDALLSNADFNPVDEKSLDLVEDYEIDPLHDLSKDLGLDLDLDSLLDGNNTDADLGILLDTFTKEFGEEERVSDSVFYTLVIIYGVVISVGLVGNIVILYAILSKKGMRTARNYFILCLAFSDLLLCACTMPLTLWEVLSRKWIFGKDLQWLCQLAHSCQGTPVFLSSMAIVAIAVDRYRCIMQPDKPHFSGCLALLISLLMTAVSILLCVPLYVSAEVKTFIEFPDAANMEDILICQDTWAGKLKVAYTVVASVAQFFLPVTLVIVLYISIYLKLKNRPQSQHQENNEKRRRTNIMICSITVIFFVSWLPLNVFNFLMDMYPEQMKALIAGNETVIYAVLHLFGMCNALTNPILYGYLNENFRKEYKNIYRQMPWHSSSRLDGGLDMAVHYHMINGSNPELHQEFGCHDEQRRKSAAILTIDRNNVNVIGPACIAQRLMFAAAAAAAAAPKEEPSNDDEELDFNFDETEHGTREIQTAAQPASVMVAGGPDTNENVTADSPTAEAVAKAFLESVDKYMMQESEMKEFSPKNGMSGVVVLGNGQIHRHYLESSQTNHNHIHTNGHQQSIEMANIPNEAHEDDNVQVVLVAPRPRSIKRKTSKDKKLGLKSHNGNAVRLLSIESFRNGGIRKPQSMDVTDENPYPHPRLPSIQRLLSIPDVLLNATMAHNAASNSVQVATNNGSTKGFQRVPRTRAVNMFVQREQVRPVYAPCHPCELEGLQETAV